MARAVKNLNRPMALLWAATATILLSGVLLILVLSPSTARDATFGARGSVALVVVALIATLLGALICAIFPRLTGGMRWGLALAIGVVGGLIGAFGLGSLFTGNVGMAILLIWATFGINIVAIQVSRAVAQ